MILEPELLAEIEAFLASSGETPTSFGRRVAADPSLISDLKMGRSVGRRLREKIRNALFVSPPPCGNQQPKEP